MIILGSLTDQISPKISIPVSLLVRATNSFAIYKLDNPVDSRLQLLIAMSVYQVTDSMATLFLSGYKYKLYPRDIRAICKEAGAICGIIGGIIYTTYFNHLFQNYGPKAPFLGVSCSDTLIALIIIVLI